jgi:pyruvate/2-oxoglutarate dehydrogenase complex dihydrolipoamide acyltransferase (E2) component
VDGIVAARFLEAFKVLLENPLRLTFNAPTEAAS